MGNLDVSECPNLSSNKMLQVEENAMVGISKFLVQEETLANSF